MLESRQPTIVETNINEVIYVDDVAVMPGVKSPKAFGMKAGLRTGNRRRDLRRAKAANAAPQMTLSSLPKTPSIFRRADIRWQCLWMSGHGLHGAGLR